MRVLVITAQYAPDLGPSAPRYAALCEDLQQRGCDVTVITGFPHYGGAEEWYPFPKKPSQEEKRNGVRVLRSYVYRAPKDVLWKRLVYHLSINISFTYAAFRVPRPDIVLADAGVFWSGLPLLVAAVVPCIPFVYIVEDIYPDVFTRINILNNRSLLWLIGRVEQAFYNWAARVSVLSEGFKANLLRKGVQEKKIVVIPIGVDADFIRPLARKNRLREEWGLANKFVVLYAGNIGFSQGLDTLIEAAGLLRDRDDIALVLVGEGSAKPALQAMAAEMSLTNLHFFPFQPHQQLPLVYALADMSLVSLKSDIIDESVPSKTYSIMASGRPIIAAVNHGTEVARLVDQVRCGLAVEPENADALAQAVLQLCKDTPRRIEMGERGRSFVVEHCSRDIVSERYYAMINKLVAR